VIDELAALIPPSLAGVNGKVFYSGRDAFLPGRQAYILGYSPAGDVKDHATETVAWHTHTVLKVHRSNWSAYRDERWFDRGRLIEPGEATFQPVVRNLLEMLGFDPGETPASNLIFARSVGLEGLADAKTLERLCWPFHEEAIRRINPHFVVCLGKKTGLFIESKLGARQVIDCFLEKNNRRWQSEARITQDGKIVFRLSDPSRAKWTTQPTDPRPWVAELCRKHA
jgi:hypothetical protein